MVSVEEFRTLSPNIREVVLRHEQAMVAARCSCSGLYQSEDGGTRFHLCAGHRYLQELEKVHRELQEADRAATQAQPQAEWPG